MVCFCLGVWSWVEEALASTWRIRSRVTLKTFPHLPRSAFFHHRDQNEDANIFFLICQSKWGLHPIVIVPHEWCLLDFHHSIKSRPKWLVIVFFPIGVSRETGSCAIFKISSSPCLCRQIHVFSNLFRCWSCPTPARDFVLFSWTQLVNGFHHATGN